MNLRNTLEKILKIHSDRKSYTDLFFHQLSRSKSARESDNSAMSIVLHFLNSMACIFGNMQDMRPIEIRIIKVQFVPRSVGYRQLFHKFEP